MRKKYYKLLLPIIIAIDICSSFIDIYAKTNPQKDSSCTPDATIKYDQYLILNNTWNAPKKFTQCIGITKNRTPKIQWNWNYPIDHDGVNAYPSILFGQSPWNSRPTTTKKLPVTLQNIKSLKAEYQVVQNIKGWYNLAIDGWISQSLVSSPENIKYEYMIWEDYSDIDDSQLGKFEGKIKTTHGEYTIYTKIPTWNPPGTSWVYILFLSNKKHTSGIIDIDQLLNFAIEKNIIPKNYYLNTVEFGNEVTPGSGSTIISKYNLSLQTKK